ncbi:MAG TPA: antibiotic biosynthesis monooxygenase [Candidatus Acidoferrales bacterium]|nr:antibiotic biosynthesis monooxygenase [Candidatus Acidoferrales bacterium]
MFGTVARFRVKSGKEQELMTLSQEFEQSPPEAWMSTTIYKSAAHPGEYWMAVAFRDEASYKANADSPRQQEWYEKMRAVLESDPEWHDGEVVRAEHRH